jgi:hypothetical protein
MFVLSQDLQLISLSKLVSRSHNILIHILATTPTILPTTAIISMIRTGLIVYIAAETDIAENHEIENVLKDHERNYERKIES